MKKIFILQILILIISVNSETLFEVKDASNHSVFDVSTDGIRIMNYPDTLMIISSSEIRANIDTYGKGLSRTFSITTPSSVKGIGTDVFEVTSKSSKMREGVDGDQYTDFSPDNIFIGLNSGINSRPGQVEPYYGRLNTFLGNYAGYSNTYGFGNIYIGYESGYFCTASSQNIYIGYNAGYNTSGQSNTFVGHMAGKGNGNGGDYNSFFGRSAGFSIGTGASNTLLGGGAGASLVNGYSNTLVGKDAGNGQDNASFSYNTVLGSVAATQLSTGGNNVVVGYNSGGSLSTGSGNIFLGYQAGGTENGSNKLYLDNSNTATPLLYGDFSTDELTVNGALTATGNSFVGGTFLKMVNNPGAGATPSNYVYQGGSMNSTGKEYAFTVYDALWVTSNAFIDGNLQIKGGTEIGKTQAGSYAAGTHTSGVKTVTITFPTAFSSIPKINVTPRGGNFTDVFAVTTRNITTTTFQVNIVRVDSSGAGWAQSLLLDWFAWE